jgi:hypothetical protein
MSRSWESPLAALLELAARAADCAAAVSRSRRCLRGDELERKGLETAVPRPTLDPVGWPSPCPSIGGVRGVCEARIAGLAGPKSLVLNPALSKVRASGSDI